MTKGFAILARRFKSRYGEIDLIAVRRDLVICVEVKARANLADAAYAVGIRQRRRILKAGLDWLARHPKYSRHDVRFDVILIGRRGLLKHIKGAFDADIGLAADDGAIESY